MDKQKKERIYNMLCNSGRYKTRMELADFIERVIDEEPSPDLNFDSLDSLMRFVMWAVHCKYIEIEGTRWKITDKGAQINPYKIGEVYRDYIRFGRFNTDRK